MNNHLAPDTWDATEMQADDVLRPISRPLYAAFALIAASALLTMCLGLYLHRHPSFFQHPPRQVMAAKP